MTSAWPTSAPPANSSPNFSNMARDNINIGIVGLGFMAAMHIRAYREVGGVTIGAICDLDFDRIRALDAGEGEQIPTLDEVLALVQGQVKLLCELKGEGVENATIDAVKARGMTGEVYFTCFNMDRLEAVRRLGDDLLIGAILPDPEEKDIARAFELGAAGIGIQYRNLCLRQVERVLDAGLDLRAWNPDTLPEQLAMIALGVKGVSSNRPDILLDHLNKQKADA